MKNLLKKTIDFLAAIPLVAGLTISVAQADPRYQHMQRQPATRGKR